MESQTENKLSSCTHFKHDTKLFIDFIDDTCIFVYRKLIEMFIS